MTKFRSLIRPFAAAPLACLLLCALPWAAQAQLQSPGAAAGLRVPVPAARSAAAPNAAASRQADFIVAVVNSEPITNVELRKKVQRAEQQIAQQGGTVPPRAELVRAVMERMIVDKAQLQLARDSGLRVEDNALQAAVQSVAAQNQISTTELRARLKADGIAYSEFENNVRDELLVTRLRQRDIDARVKVSERDIDDYLAEKSSASTTVPEINLAQILVAVPEGATPEKVAALQAKAQQALDKARAGGDFAALSKEYSDADVRNEGGEMGLREASRYPPLFVNATQNAAPGGLVGLVRSPAGFHVLKVLQRSAGGLPGSTVVQTHARHILLRPSAKLSEAAVVEKLSALRKRIVAGQLDFAAAAKDVSEDGSAKDGGDLGWSNPGMFVPEFEEALNDLQLNEVSAPVVSRFGVHLMQVLERRETRLSEREQREQVRAIVREKKLEEAYNRWLQDLRAQAYVEYREAPQ